MINKYDIAIVDDCVDDVEILKTRLNELKKEFEVVFSIHHFENPIVYLMENQVYDFVFLNLDMDTMNGLAYVDKIALKRKSEKMIFLSSSDQYLLDGYRYRPYGFLIKNHVSFQCLLKETMERLLKICDDVYITLQSKEGMVKVPYRFIVYCWVNEKIVYFYTPQGIYHRSMTMIALEQEFTHLDNFYRINRNEIINIDYVSEMKDKEVIMKDGKVFKISTRRWRSLRKLYRFYKSKTFD